MFYAIVNRGTKNSVTKVVKLAKISIYTVHVLSQSEYHDLLVPVDRDDLGVAVWLTGVVDEPRLVARHSGIHYFIVINTEHVTTNALGGGGGDRGRGAGGTEGGGKGGQREGEGERQTEKGGIVMYV